MIVVVSDTTERDRWHFGDRWYEVTMASVVSHLDRDGMALELDDIGPSPGRGLVLEAFYDDDTGHMTFTSITTEPLPFLLVEAEAAAPILDLGTIPVTDLRGHAGHDVDYYAWEVVRILKIVDKIVRAGLRGGSEVERAREALREEAPLLEAFRNEVTHVEDNRGADDIVYFGDAVRLLAGGRVQYVVDPSHRLHDLLADLVAAAEAALLTLAVADDGAPPRYDNTRD